MSIHKSKYTFKDRSWYIVPWSKIDPDTVDLHTLPSYLVHDVNGYVPHTLTLWNYGHLEDDTPYCYNCGCKPSKKIQTLWVLENMDNPSFYEDY